MKNQRGFTLVELMIGIAILSIILTILFSIFSNSYAFSRNQASKQFIESQQKLIYAHLQREFNQIGKFDPNCLPQNNLNFNLPLPFISTDNSQDLIYSYDATSTTFSGTIREAGRCLMIRENNHEIYRSEECIDPNYRIQFTASYEDNRFIRIKMYLFDPRNPDYQLNPDDQESRYFPYEITLYAPNAERT